MSVTEGDIVTLSAEAFGFYANPFSIVIVCSDTRIMPEVTCLQTATTDAEPGRDA